MSGLNEGIGTPRLWDLIGRRRGRAALLLGVGLGVAALVAVGRPRFQEHVSAAAFSTEHFDPMGAYSFITEIVIPREVQAYQTVYPKRALETEARLVRSTNVIRFITPGTPEETAHIKALHEAIRAAWIHDFQRGTEPYASRKLAPLRARKERLEAELQLKRRLMPRVGALAKEGKGRSEVESLLLRSRQEEDRLRITSIEAELGEVEREMKRYREIVPLEVMVETEARPEPKSDALFVFLVGTMITLLGTFVYLVLTEYWETLLAERAARGLPAR